MPKAPITARTLIYTTNSDGSFRLADWNLVSTSVGQMVEPRVMARRPGDSMQNEDLLDSSYTDLLRITAPPTGNYALDQLLFGSTQWPHYRDNDPIIVE
jgi:hypothetical protein